MMMSKAFLLMIWSAASFSIPSQELVVRPTSGDAPSQFQVGLMLLNAEGQSEHDSLAVEWYRKAPEKGYPLAQYNLGYMQLNGRGHGKSDTKAFKWSLTSA